MAKTISIDKLQKKCRELEMPMQIGKTDQFTLGYNQSLDDMMKWLSHEACRVCGVPKVYMHNGKNIWDPNDEQN